MKTITELMTTLIYPIILPFVFSLIGGILGYIIGDLLKDRKKHRWHDIWEKSRKEVKKDTKRRYIKIVYSNASSEYRENSVISEVQDDTTYIADGINFTLHKNDVKLDNDTKTFNVNPKNHPWIGHFRLPFDCIRGIYLLSKPVFYDLGKLEEGEHIYQVSLYNDVGKIIIGKNITEVKDEFLDKFTHNDIATNNVTRSYNEYLKKLKEKR